MKNTLLLFAIIFLKISCLAQAPTLSISQPTCASPYGTVEVTSPLSNAGPIASNLYISEVTDASLGGLSYIEIFNGTGAAVNLSNYKLKIYLNGFSTASCDLTLSGSVNAYNTFVVAIGSSTNQGGVAPNLTFAACAGFNTNDAVMLTAIDNTAIDLWGATDGTVFTPLGQPGYTYRRHTNAPVPSFTWNPADWTTLDPEDYSNVGVYSTAVDYQYSLDGGPFQTSPFFDQMASGSHVIAVQNSVNSLTTQTSFEITQAVPGTPVLNFFYTTPTCQRNGLLYPIIPSDFTFGGTFLATQPLVIDPSSGIINLDLTPPGSYFVNYVVAPNIPLCIAGGANSFNVIVRPTNPMPEGNPDQTILTTNPTLTDLYVIPSNVSWYGSYSDSIYLINQLPANTPLVDGVTYFAVNAQILCPSIPFPVTVHLNLSTAAFTDFSFDIAPNPAKTILTIQTNNNLTIDKIILSDISGKTVMTQTSAPNNQVNVEQLAAGMYLIKAFSGDQKFQAKFIKQ
ncbi:T9SS type A sorting domain-containing protein [Flavobacterium sp.]|uniref:T9SS type A sorting domain-containing protein n=1 Tax=Flavobacterium sp. TaxID=239 RepID=UPI00262F8A05|nr:T9SS type A sorting domain-containing protein [Flavobacterium sp.]